MKDVLKSGQTSKAMIIEGRCEDDSKFRPSDWVERISSMLASFGADNKLCYSEYVHPRVVNGERCLVVADGLNHVSPAVFDYIMQFAKENRLRINHHATESRSDKGSPVTVDVAAKFCQVIKADGSIDVTACQTSQDSSADQIVA